MRGAVGSLHVLDQTRDRVDRALKASWRLQALTGALLATGRIEPGFDLGATEVDADSIHPVVPCHSGYTFFGPFCSYLVP